MVSRVFRSHGWDAITVDSDPRWRPDVECQVEHFVYRGPSPDLVWASPPCTTFSLAHYLRGAVPSGADWPLVQLTRRKMLALRPRYWIIENVRGLLNYWPQYAQVIGPWYLWGHFPPIPDPGPVWKSGHSWFRSRRYIETQRVLGVAVPVETHRSPAERAAIPRALAEAVYRAIAQQPALFE